MEGGPAPIRWRPDQAVLDRVPVQIVEVRFQVIFVAASVIPEPPLPHAALLAFPAGRRNVAFCSASVQEGIGEFRLDAAPARRVVAVVQRHRPDCVKMIRQHDDSADFEGMLASDFPKGSPQCCDTDRRGEDGPSLVGHHSEEVGLARQMPAAVVGHVGSAWAFGLGAFRSTSTHPTELGMGRTPVTGSLPKSSEFSAFSRRSAESCTPRSSMTNWTRSKSRWTT